MFIQWRQHYIPLINEIIPEKEYIVHCQNHSTYVSMATTTQIVSLSTIMFMWFPLYSSFLSGNCQLNHVSMYEMLEDAIQTMYKCT